MQTVLRIALIMNLVLAVPAVAQPGKDGAGKKQESRTNHNQSGHKNGKAGLNSSAFDKGAGKREQAPGKQLDHDRSKRDSIDQRDLSRSPLNTQRDQTTLGQTEKASKRTITETQQQNIDKLTKDLQGLKAGSEVTPEMVTQLKIDLMSMCDNANKPSQESVQKLSNDLSTALSDKTLSNQEKSQLAKDLQAVMTSANLNPDEVQDVKTDMQTILTASNVTKDDVKLIISDVQAIITGIKKNAVTK